MTLNEFKLYPYNEEAKEIAKYISNWLQSYTHEVVIEVIKNHIEKIFADEHTQYLLKELYEREQEEIKSHINSISNYIWDFKTFSQYDLHNHCTSHSKSYRDVLYDMYIKTKKESK